MNKSVEGLWTLASMEQRYDDGRVIYPFGENAQGRLYYAADGTMFVAIQKDGRQPFKSGKQWTASAEEKANAYNDYLTYAGRYELNGDEICHFIEISLFPDWIGAQQKRKVCFEAGRLQLVARLEENTPEARTALLIWERSSGAPDKEKK